MEREQIIEESFLSLPYEELEQRRQQAVQNADYKTLRAIEAEARARDGLDDTDARFNYLAVQCAEDINEAMTYYG